MKFTKRLAATAVAAATLCSSAAFNSALNLSADAATDSSNYAKLLQYSMYMYDANMCGSQVGEKSDLKWRDDCHTADEVPGGFHDCGDHVKFGITAGFSASTLGLGYYEFGSAYDALGQTGHLKTVTDYFCDYFKASTVLSGDSVSKFCYQIGDGNADHMYWGSPELQDQSSRKAFWTTSGASDIAAAYAAGLAANYVNFGNAEDLKYAKALYKFSKQYNQCATEGTTGFYNSSDCKDDQAWAAGWLYLATKDSSYNSDLQSYLTTEKQWGEVYWPHCWNDVSMGAAVMNGLANNEWKWAEGYLKKNCTSTSQYLCVDEWGSARINFGVQLPAMIVSKHTSSDYKAWCKAQTAMILGDNPQSKGLVCGFNDVSPKNPHHRASSGYQNGQFTENTTQAGSGAHVLVGALVGGPKGSDFSTYEDSMQNFVTNEVGIDYNACMVGVAAALYDTYKTGSVASVPESRGNTSSVTPTPGTTATTPKQTTVTTTQKPNNPVVTTTQGGGTSSSGGHVTNLNQNVVYSELPKGDKMFGWEWADLGVGANEKIQKVEVNISTSKSKIGKWQGAFGSSTTVAPDYWTQTDDMEQSFSGNKGTITWNVDAATAAIIQTQYKGALKLGVWWIDCDSFTVDSVVVYTDKTGSSTPAVTTTTPKQTTATTKQTTTTTIKPQQPATTTTMGGNDTPSTPSAGETISGVSLGKEIDLSKYKDITSIDFVFSSTPSNGNGAVVFGQWEYTVNFDMKDLKNNTLTVKPDKDYKTVTVNKYYSDTDTNLVSVIVHTKSDSAAATTPQQTTATTPKQTTATTPKQTTATTPKQTTATTQKPNNPTTTTAAQPSGSKLPGDVNLDGKISLTDVIILNKAIAGKLTLNSAQLANADVSGNGSMGPEDSQALLVKIVTA